MWSRWFGLEAKRARLLRSAPPGPLRDYYSVPFPLLGTRLRAVRFVGLDLETSGLEEARHEILSAGLVELGHDAIDLSTAMHLFVAPTRPLPEGSVVIHHITDDRAAGGQHLAEVLPRVLERLAGKVMVAHHARLEQAFLDAACRRCYGVGFRCRVVDTEALFRRQLTRRQQSLRPGDLRLAALRENCGLPRYRAHDALSDALGAAELFLAYVSHAQLAADEPLRSVLTGP